MGPGHCSFHLLEYLCPTDLENRLVNSGGRSGWDGLREWYWYIYTTTGKIGSSWEAAVQHRELGLVLCDDLEGWDDGVGGRLRREGICVCVCVCVCVYTYMCSVQFSSVAQPCPTLCDPMDCSMPGLPVHHQLPEFTQTHVHWVGDVIQLSYPLSSPSPPTFNIFQHQGLFKWVSSSHKMAKILEFQLQHQSSNEHPGLISFTMDWLDLQSKGLSRVFSNITVQKHQFFSAQISL